jgi:hypothetical protein
VNSPSDKYLSKDYPVEGRTRGWRFRVDEISANVYKVEGSDGRGRSVSRTGTDPDRLIEACEADAREIGGGGSDIQPPVFVIEGGDVSVYESLEDATNGLEGVDVADGIYTLFDSVGKRIRLRADGVRRGRFVVDIGTVSVDAIEESSEGPAELHRALREYARRLGRTDLDSADLHRLVDAMSRHLD